MEFKDFMDLKYKEMIYGTDITTLDSKLTTYADDLIVVDGTTITLPTGSEYEYDPFTGGFVATGYSLTMTPSKNSQEIERRPSMETTKLKINDKYSKYTIKCHDASDLSEQFILKTLAIMKSDLTAMYNNSIDIGTMESIECIMTPTIKNAIINAYRKSNMFGKKIPFIACFDEYGERLPDKITIEGVEGITVKIVDPKKYGDNYLSLEIIVSKDFELPF